ncbi:uncharacterized protein LOC142348299 isoform X2 [Convolutriloba macropyga]|uniref:uncharacterized protein LOC142348299 isoform X2 n=1 Tax=Convolutriloba macropyga TaxID=536237 RepID=UPI003F5256DA
MSNKSAFYNPSLSDKSGKSGKSGKSEKKRKDNKHDNESSKGSSSKSSSSVKYDSVKEQNQQSSYDKSNYKYKSASISNSSSKSSKSKKETKHEANEMRDSISHNDETRRGTLRSRSGSRVSSSIIGSVESTRRKARAAEYASRTLTVKSEPEVEYEENVFASPPPPPKPTNSEATSTLYDKSAKGKGNKSQISSWYEQLSKKYARGKKKRNETKGSQSPSESKSATGDDEYNETKITLKDLYSASTLRSSKARDLGKINSSKSESPNDVDNLSTSSMGNGTYTLDKSNSSAGNEGSENEILSSHLSKKSEILDNRSLNSSYGGQNSEGKSSNRQAETKFKTENRLTGSSKDLIVRIAVPVRDSNRNYDDEKRYLTILDNKPNPFFKKARHLAYKHRLIEKNILCNEPPVSIRSPKFIVVHRHGFKSFRILGDDSRSAFAAIPQSRSQNPDPDDDSLYYNGIKFSETGFSVISSTRSSWDGGSQGSHRRRRKRSRKYSYYEDHTADFRDTPRVSKFEDHDDSNTYSNPQHEWETSVSRSKPSSRREQQKSVHFSNHGDVSDVFLYEGHTKESKESVARKERSSPSEESRSSKTMEPSRKSLHDSTRDGNTHEEMSNCVDEIASLMQSLNQSLDPRISEHNKQTRNQFGLSQLGQSNR